MNLIVKNIINSNVAISMEKGEKLLKEIQKALNSEDDVIVDFEGVSDLTTAFLNVAIGHLYLDYSKEVLNAKLQIANLDELDLYLISQVIERVKMNQEKRSDFLASIEEAFDDGDDS